MSRARTPLLAARLLQQCSGSACRAALDSAWSAALLNDVLAQSALLCCSAAARPAMVEPLFFCYWDNCCRASTLGYARQLLCLRWKREYNARSTYAILCCLYTGSKADEQPAACCEAAEVLAVRSWRQGPAV